MVDKQKIRDLPLQPGVYIMRDSGGNIIYIGKAKILKNRVSQYFNNSPKPVKVQAMVSNIADFEYIITLSESDALALESNLIKKHQPYYNILLKDDKSDPYIKIDTRCDYPTIEVTRKVKNDGAKYFGPYFNGLRVNEIVGVIRAVYGMRTCPKKLKKQSRACLNYDIGLCKGCCMGYVKKEEYAETVKEVMRFLGGREDTAQKVLEEKMMKFAQNEDFERAIEYRDKLEMLKKLKARTIASLGSVADLDVFAYATDGTYSVIAVAMVRANKMLGVKTYPIIDVSLELGEVYSQFVLQYYQSPALLPQEICFANEFDGEALSTQLSLSVGKVDITFPKIGAKNRLVQMAKTNASEYLEKNIAKNEKEKAMTTGAVERLAEIFDIKTPTRIECFDISDISGTDKVASDVCFIDGKAEKSEYRRYKIKTVKGADDFASMKEVITRRLNKIDEGWPTPDLIVVDGGKGQLSVALEAMEECGKHVPVISLAKKEEEVFVPYKDEPIILSRDDNALKLLQRVRDEAHRFAVIYHRNLRSKNLYSELERIPNIGKKTRQILISAFESLDAIRNATLEELESVSGLNKRAVRSVYDYYKARREQGEI